LSTEENKALQAELKAELASDSTKSVSEVAQSMQQNKASAQTEVKTRDLKDFIKTKSEKQIQKAERVCEKQQRSYIVYPLANDSKHAQVYFSTTYVNPLTNAEEQLNIAITRKLVADYLQSIAAQTHFTTSTLQKHFTTRGSNYCDLLRSALYEVGLLVSKADATDKLADCIARAVEHKKLIVYFNTTEDSRHKKYEYIRI
jgi:hypothetical protein